MNNPKGPLSRWRREAGTAAQRAAASAASAATRAWAAGTADGGPLRNARADVAGAGYARVAAVAGAFANAFTDPETALALYLAAFVCDELVRAARPRGRGVASLD